MARKKKRATDRLAVQNAAKTLLANIRFASIDAPVQAVTVTSSVPNEGKSTVALNLAQAMATSGARTLLVETDMRRRSMASMVGVHARGGIYAVLSGQMELEDAVVETNQPNLFFLDAEPHIPNPADIIASRRFAKFVEELKGQYRYIVFDTPPVGTFVDAAEVGRLCDGVAFVIRQDFTKRNEVVEAVDQLRKAEVNILGTVMNYCESDTSEYYYAYYNKQGDRVRSSEGKKSQLPANPPAPSAPLTAASVSPLPAKAPAAAPAPAPAQATAPVVPPAAAAPSAARISPSETSAYLNAAGRSSRTGTRYVK